jgi:hypothetical protein
VRSRSSSQSARAWTTLSAAHGREAGSNNWVSVRIEQLDLLAARAHDNFASKVQAEVLHGRDHGREVAHGQDEAIPSAWILLLAVWQRTSPRTAWTTKKNVNTAARHVCERRPLLVLQLETQLLRVERNRAIHVSCLITDSVNPKRSHRHVASFSNRLTNCTGNRTAARGYASVLRPLDDPSSRATWMKCNP